MRSTHRKTKRRSCALCKPHKMGWAPKDTDKYQADELAAEAEIRIALCPAHSDGSSCELNAGHSGKHRMTILDFDQAWL